MKCCTRLRCSSESPLELHADSSLSAEDVRPPCSAIIRSGTTPLARPCEASETYATFWGPVT